MLIDPSRGVSLAGAASPPLEFAIGELTDTLSAMSGRPVPRVQKDAAVTVGRRSAFGAAGLPRADGFDGYALSAGPDGVRIAGDNERGCIYGVYDLLERLGCLWLAPDQDPLDPPHIPKSDRLDVPEGAWAVASPVRWRVCNASSWFFEMDTDIAIRQMDWGMKLRYNTMGWQAENRTPLLAQYQILKDSGVLRELTRRGMMLHGPAHSFDHFLPNELFEEHPEWFGMRDGARVKQVFGGAQFCWSNPDARRAFVDNAEAFALAVPELSVFCTLGFDGGPCCQCPRCAASEPADLVMGLMAELAERLAVSRPGLPVETSGGYNPVHEPPQNARIHKDVRVVWAHWGRWHGEGYSDASYAWKDNLELWRDAVDGRLTLTQYYTDNFAEPWVAAPYSRAIVSDRKWVLENGVDGWYMLMWPKDYWWNHSLNAMLGGRCLYDVTLDPYELTKQIARRYFGPGAGELLAEYWDEWGRNVELAYAVRDGSKPADRETLARQRRELIEPAVAAASADPVFAHRAGKVEKLHRMAERLTRVHAMREEIEALKSAGQPCEAELQQAREYTGGVLAFLHELADLEQGLVDRKEIPTFMRAKIVDWLEEVSDSVRTSP